jgi:hypothetical protein
MASCIEPTRTETSVDHNESYAPAHGEFAHPSATAVAPRRRPALPTSVARKARRGVETCPMSARFRALVCRWTSGSVRRRRRLDVAGRTPVDRRPGSSEGSDGDAASFPADADEAVSEGVELAFIDREVDLVKVAPG